MCFCMLIVAPDVLSFYNVLFQIDVMKFGQNDFQLSGNKITRCIVEQRLVIDVTSLLHSLSATGFQNGQRNFIFCFFTKLQYLFYKQLDNTEFLFKWLKVYCIVSIYTNDIVFVEMCYCMLILASDVLSFFIFFKLMLWN